MELATFSDVEFVGIAADRHVVVDSNHRGRRESTSGSSTISLASAGSEIQRHDKSLKASAFDIHEVYSVVPLSPSSFMVDPVPDNLPGLIDEGPHTSNDECNLPTVSTWSATPSTTSPLERFRLESQRHERVAVSVALGQPCEHVVSDASPFECYAFTRSPAPSPSSRRGLGASGDDIEGSGYAVTAGSVMSAPGYDDDQSLLKTYSLERWFGSTMEKTQELAVELQHPGAQSTLLMPPSLQQPKSATDDKFASDELNHEPPSSSISLGRIDPGPMLEDDDDGITGESIRAFTEAFLSKQRREMTKNRTHREQRYRKRKNVEDHHQNRPARPSPAHVSDY